eukprot:scaffold65_cov353-Prasinococcus_capsulatus_cf.AAC.7
MLVGSNSESDVTRCQHRPAESLTRTAKPAHAGDDVTLAGALPAGRRPHCPAWAHRRPAESPTRMAQRAHAGDAVMLLGGAFVFLSACMRRQASMPSS